VCSLRRILSLWTVIANHPSSPPDPPSVILSSRTLTPYLLDRGLVAPAEVADGDLSIADMTRRNRNFRVSRGAGRPGLFVKQPQDWEPYSADTLRREATCYLLARDDADFAALGGLLPRFVDYDASAAVLALELLPGDESLGDYHQRQGGFPTAVAERIGTMLGSCHRHAGGRTRDAGRDAAFPSTARRTRGRSAPGTRRSRAS
jgi:hypothetical protein